jgi:hypothetical protein
MVAREELLSLVLKQFLTAVFSMASLATQVRREARVSWQETSICSMKFR